MKTSLPIDSRLSEVLYAIRGASNFILQASPGSGKTTRVPPAVLFEPWAVGKEIWVLVPRRLAAKMGAIRVAEEMGEQAGETVGYQFRFEKVLGPTTRLKFLTEGMLLRLLMSDPALSGVAAVILDEFHERHLQTDVALAYLKWLQQTRRPDLKVVIMSATLDTKPLAAYLGNCPVVILETPLHPVRISYIQGRCLDDSPRGLSTGPVVLQVRKVSSKLRTCKYLPRPNAEWIEKSVASAVRKTLSVTRGDMLVFLPGMNEIRRCEQRLMEEFKREIVVIPLHSALSKEEQGRAFQKFSSPKVILATNIAETSLTFDGVETVIDSGLHRQASYSWWSGIPMLKTRNISKASAVQRAGRAGRTGPGNCFRLYTQSDFEGRPDFDLPEIRRSDLGQVFLEIKRLGVPLRDFSWFESPPPQAIEAACLLLWELGAIGANEPDAPLTDLGRRMAEFPLHPRLARSMIEAEKRDVTEQAASIAVDLSEGDSPNASRLKSQILSSVRRSSRGNQDDVAFSFLTGFPDRVAQRRKEAKGVGGELVFASGGSAKVEATGDRSTSGYFVVLDAQERKKQGSAKSFVQVTSLLPIREEWLLDLTSGLLREVDELVWNASLKKVYQVSRLSYGELVLSESKGDPRDLKKAAYLLLSEGLGLRPSKDLSVVDLLKVLEHVMDPEPVESALARINLLGVISADLKGGELMALIEKAFAGMTDMAEVSAEGLSFRFLEIQSSETRGRIDSLLPTHIMLKNRRVRVRYRWNQNPWIESRLQDFFGMKRGPTILGGRLPLTLHLLAPNRRPVQVTQDLASFWQNAYPKIRKELCRRYPKHAWIEDPMRG